MVLVEETAAKSFGEVGLGSQGRLFPGFSENSAEQPTLSAGQSGIGCLISVAVARPARLVIAAGPKASDMIRDVTSAGLVAAQPLLTRLDALVENAAANFLDTPDDNERATAHTTARQSQV